MRMGIECEGVYSGLTTLFVPDGSTNKEILAAFRNKVFQHVYIGADSKLPRWDQIRFILDQANFYGRVATVEVPINKADEVPINIIGKVRFIFTIKIGDKYIHRFDAFAKNDQIKIESKDKCYLFPIGSALVNEKNYLDHLI